MSRHDGRSWKLITSLPFCLVTRYLQPRRLEITAVFYWNQLTRYRDSLILIVGCVAFEKIKMEKNEISSVIRILKSRHTRRCTFAILPRRRRIHLSSGWILIWKSSSRIDLSNARVLKFKLHTHLISQSYDDEKFPERSRRHAATLSKRMLKNS